MKTRNSNSTLVEEELDRQQTAHVQCNDGFIWLGSFDSRRLNVLALPIYELEKARSAVADARTRNIFFFV